MFEENKIRFIFVLYSCVPFYTVWLVSAWRADTSHPGQQWAGRSSPLWHQWTGTHDLPPTANLSASVDPPRTRKSHNCIEEAHNYTKHK